MPALLSHKNTPKLFTPAQVRSQDQQAIEQCGCTALGLMRRAGAALFELLQAKWPEVDSVTVYCGKGNNGGDGYILAGLAAAKGFKVELLRAETADLTKTAGEARSWCLEQGAVESPATGAPPTGAVIVDALLGTGSQGRPRSPYDALIEAINRSDKPVLSADLPSGLDALLGVPAEFTVQADVTLTFVGIKRGLVTGRALNYCGQVYFDDLQIPPEAYHNTAAQGIPWLRYEHFLPKRLKAAHKGLFGRGLLIGGGGGSGGAVLLAAESALRSGIGLLAIATVKPEHVSAILARRPEAMAGCYTNTRELNPLLEWAEWIACGPGLGTDSWAEEMLQAALSSGRPMVLDADALNLLATQQFNLPSTSSVIMTPHPGEAARLLDTDVAAIEADRFRAAEALAEQYKAWVVLKGAGSILAAPRQGVIGVCGHGNPGMAGGGMGDVLTGLILALGLQTKSPDEAIKLAVCAHALAADRLVAGRGEIGLLAGDLPTEIGRLLNGY